MPKKRIIYIDSLKGLLIILVVLGHVIQFLYSPDNFDNNRIYRYIYCFHMSLFMMLSGFVTPVEFESFSQVMHKLSKRFMQLVIPFISWSALDLLLIGRYDIFRVLRNPEYGLWFLWVLFWINTFFIVGLWAMKFIKPSNIYISILIVYIVLRIFRLVFSGNYGVDLMVLYYPYFSIGSILGYIASSTHSYKFQTRFLIYITIILFFIYIIGGYFYYRVLPIMERNWIIRLNSISIYRCIVALSGCFSFFFFFHLLDKTAILRRLNFHKLGIITLPIYAIHQIVIRRVFMPCSTIHDHELFTTWYGSIVAFTLVMFSSCIVYSIFKRNKYLCCLFLGINKSNESISRI